MKIAFFNSIKFWGGGEKWHYETAVSLSEMNHQVYFFGNPNGKIHDKLQAHPNISFVPVNLSNLSFLNPFKVNRLAKILRKEQIETIIINHPGDLKIAANAANKAGVKRIIYRRGSAIPIKNKWLNRYIFKNWVTDILANSQATKKTILQNNPNLFPEEKIKVIYNYIDIQAFLQRESAPKISRENNEIIIGNLGRLSFQKNQKFLIDLSKKLTEQNIHHKIYIGGTGELETELKQYNKDQNTEENVIFTGFETNVKDFLSGIDVFFLSSVWEGFGYVLVEANLCEKPCIAFDDNSMPELVKNEYNGFLITPNNLDEAVEKIKIFVENPQLISTYGQNGKEFAQKHFSKEIIMQQLTDYLL
ncbi:MAG TPA: glycosyltransferase [Flavobacterium sp.]|nr:glycosyltransferase [Flavobacterium sp.]